MLTKLDRPAMGALLKRARVHAIPQLERFRRAASSPQNWLVWLTGGVLWAVFIAYCDTWLDGHWRALTDPNLQTDDARTALFPFHRYAPGAPLADDPIANEMIEYQPYAFRLLYWILVPQVGLLAATKWVQGLCLLIIAAGGVVLWRSKQAGAATGALLVFFFIHDVFVMGRIGGGLPRGFGFPAIALWFAGALADSAWTRRSAAAIAAFTYPSALAMILGAEGLYMARDMGRTALRTSARRVRDYLLLVGFCALLLAPVIVFGSKDGGPVHTMEQAEQEPAFGRTGRLWLLPLDDPGTAFGTNLLKPFLPQGRSLITDSDLQLNQHAKEAALLVMAVLIALPLMGLTASPLPALAFLAASFILYVVSVKYAFRLYSPERYYSYGMRAAALGLVIGVFGLVLPRLSPLYRSALRNCVAAAVILGVWTFMGDAARPRRGNPMSMSVNQLGRAPLWQFIRENLPKNARIASHINDGDDIPLFTQRANNGGFETLQPWLTLSWARQKGRAEETLRALYATNPEEVLAYTRKYGVTHLLLNRERYQDDFVAKARSFDPLTGFARELLADRALDELVLAKPPKEAVMHRFRSLLLVDVARLEEAWSTDR